jgi:hypothetical protein
MKAYEVLGVEPNADRAAINAAFRRAAKNCHPDLHPRDRLGERHLRQLIAARAVLIRTNRSKFYSGTSRLCPTVLFSKGRWRVLVASASVATMIALLCAFQQLGFTLAIVPFETRTLERKYPAYNDNLAWTTAMRDLREILRSRQ